MGSGGTRPGSEPCSALSTPDPQFMSNREGNLCRAHLAVWLKRKTRLVYPFPKMLLFKLSENKGKRRGKTEERRGREGGCTVCWR